MSQSLAGQVIMEIPQFHLDNPKLIAKSRLRRSNALSQNQVLKGLRNSNRSSVQHLQTLTKVRLSSSRLLRFLGRHNKHQIIWMPTEGKKSTLRASNKRFNQAKNNLIRKAVINLEDYSISIRGWLIITLIGWLNSRLE
jgi:hypothetical protein